MDPGQVPSLNNCPEVYHYNTLTIYYSAIYDKESLKTILTRNYFCLTFDLTLLVLYFLSAEGLTGLMFNLIQSLCFY